MRWLCVSLLLGCGVDIERNPFTGACGPADGGEDVATQPLPEGLLVSLGVAGDFGSSAVDALDVANLGAVDSRRLVGSGDAALRPLGDQAVLLNRGLQSNLQLIDGGTLPGAQISLGRCNPHDAVMLDGCEALVTCYDDSELKIVDLAGGHVRNGPDLSLLDGGERPEADQLLRLGDVILVSLQRLDDTYSATGPGLVAELDAATLELRETLTLPCENPFTDFTLLPDGRPAIACAGDFTTSGEAGLAAIDLDSGDSELLASGAELGGVPGALRADSQGRAVVLVSVPDAADPFIIDEMRLVRLDARFDGATEILHETPGFSLSGLAVGPDDSIYFGDRSPSTHAGLWVIRPDGSLQGPVRTSLPPYEIEVW